jgi:hypothetical protein
MKKYIIPSILFILSAFGLQAQVTPTTIFVLTNLPPAIAANSTTNLFAAGTIPANNVISLRQGQGMAAAVTYNGTNSAATGGFSVNWAASLDGTNWATAGFLQITNTANGTNLCNIVTNFSSAILNNELFIAPCSIQNATASASGGVSLGNITVSFGNIVPGGYP